MPVSASRASPIGNTLDACGRFTDAAALGTLAPKLAQLIKRGVGVNTRVAAAGFIMALAARLGSDARPHTNALIWARQMLLLLFLQASSKESYAPLDNALVLLRCLYSPCHVHVVSYLMTS